MNRIPAEKQFRLFHIFSLCFSYGRLFKLTKREVKSLVICHSLPKNICPCLSENDCHDSKGPFTQAIFVSATQCHFCHTKVATSCDFIAILVQCVVPENIHTPPPHGGFFQFDPPPPWIFRSRGSGRTPPHPPEIPRFCHLTPYPLENPFLQTKMRFGSFIFILSPSI